ncbi:MAG: tetratricopeptide repeat protein [Cyanobacteria bacterium J06621_3]
MQRLITAAYQHQVAKLIYRHGVTYAQQRSYAQAIDAFTQAIEKGYQPLAKAQVMRGINRIARKDKAGAIADFETVINAAANDLEPATSALRFAQAQAHFHRGVLRQQSGQEAAALADWSTAITCCATYAQPHFHRALVYSGQGQHQQALADFDAAITSDPTFAQAYFHRGNLRYQLGDMPGAVSDWELAVCNDFSLEAAKQKLETAVQANYDARLSQLLTEPLAAKDLSVKVKRDGHTLEIHIHREVGTGVSYYTLPDLIRTHLVPLHLAEVTHFQLIGRAGDVKRPDWNQSYDLYKGQPCPKSNWEAAFSTLVLFPPFGIPAFIQASQVKRLYNKGRYVEALSASKAVKGLCVAGSIALGSFTLLPLGYAAYSSMKGVSTLALAEEQHISALEQSDKATEQKRYTPYQLHFLKK